MSACLPARLHNNGTAALSTAAAGGRGVHVGLNEGRRRRLCSPLLRRRRRRGDRNRGPNDGDDASQSQDIDTVRSAAAAAAALAARGAFSRPLHSAAVVVSAVASRPLGERKSKGVQGRKEGREGRGRSGKGVFLNEKIERERERRSVLDRGCLGRRREGKNGAREAQCSGRGSSHGDDDSN